MIKTIIKKVCVCDMCGYTYGFNDLKDGWDENTIIPKDVFEFTVNLEDGAKNIQICPTCQAKLRYALREKANNMYGFESCGCGYSKKEEKEND